MIALIQLGEELFDLSAEWIREPDIIRRLAPQAADLHEPLGLPNMTRLQYLMLYSDSASESQRIGNHWLELLASAGIDKEEHLRNEE